MRSGLGARQVQHATTIWKKQGSNFISLVALNLPPEYDMMCYYLIFHVPNFLVALIKGTLMQIWKSAYIFVFIWKQHVKNFTLKHLLFFETGAIEICEKFVYKHSETIEYVKN